MIRMRRFHKTYAVLYDVRKAHHRLVMVLLLLFFSINGLYSQKSVAKVGGEPEKYSLLPMGRNWSLGIGGGPTLSMGDLTAVNDGNIRYYTGLTAWVGKDLFPWLTLRGQVLNTRLTGHGTFVNGTDEEHTGLYIGKTFNYYLNTVVDFTGLISKQPSLRRFHWYMTIGLGFANFESVTTDQTAGKTYDQNGTGGYGSGLYGRTLEPVLPIGFGLSYRLSDRFKLRAEGTVHTVRSDKVDGIVSGSETDQYFTGSLGLEVNYHFTSAVKVEPLTYQTNPDLIPLKYKNYYSQSRGIVDPKYADKRPELIVDIPKQVTKGSEAMVGIELKNAGREGILDLEFVLPDEVSIESPGIKQISYKKTALGVNIYYKVEALDTSSRKFFNLVFKSNVNKEFPIMLDASFTAYSGEKYAFNEMEYLTFEGKSVSEESRDNKIEEELLRGRVFRVQVMTANQRIESQEQFNKLFPGLNRRFYEDKFEGTYNYTVGSFLLRSEADALLDSIVTAFRIKGAMVVLFENGTRSRQLEDLFENYENPLAHFDINTYSDDKSDKKVGSGKDPISGSEFRVLLDGSRKDRASVSDILARIGTREPMLEYQHNGAYFYFVGIFNQWKVANAYASYLKHNFGFGNVEVVAFKKGKPVSK